MYGVRTAKLAEASTLVPSLQATAIVPYKHIAWRDNKEPLAYVHAAAFDEIQIASEMAHVEFRGGSS